MTKYSVSFDDGSGHYKRLSKVYVSTYASADLYNIQSATIIGPDAVTNINAQDAALIIGADNNTNHLFIQSRSNTNQPCLNFERRRNSGATVQSGDYLGEIRFFAPTSSGWQAPSTIKAIYAGNGANFLSYLEFKVSNAVAVEIGSDFTFTLYNGSNHSVGMKASASASPHAYVLPLAQGAANQLLANDGSGNLSWVDKFTYVTLDPTITPVNAPAGSLIVWAGSTGSKFWWKRDNGSTTNVAPADPSAESSLANRDWGWLIRGTPSFSIVGGTIARLTLGAASKIMIGGREVYIPAGNYDVTSSGTAGQRYAYFDDASQTLKISTTVFDLKGSAPVFTAHWNGTAFDAIGYEMHGMRDLVWHAYQHKYVGTQYNSGLTATGNVQTDNNNNPASTTVEYLWFTTGIIADEDNSISVGTGIWTQDLGSDLTSTTAAVINFWYYNGTNVVKQLAESDRTPFIHNGGNTTPQWNNGGVLTAATTGQYVVYFYYASVLVGSDCLWARPMNAVYTSLATAQAADPSSLVWADFPADDAKYVYRAIFRVNTAWNGSTHRSKLVALDSFRLTAGTPIASVNASSHNALSGRTAADCHPTTAITNFTTEVNALITSYFSNLTDYSFDADNTGTTIFDLGFSLSDRIVRVSENGQLKREGASYDYQKSGTQVVFNYTVKNAWVGVTVSQVGVNDTNFDVGNGGQTVFDTGITLGTKRVTMYENGQLKREGALYDWTRSGTTVVTNYTVRNAWVLIIIYI